MRFYLALFAAKICARLIQIVAKGRGTNLPGEVALKLDPAFVSHFKGLDPNKAVFITGTNGKSTSTNLVHHVLTRSGLKVVSNLEGANLLAGVATALLQDCTLTGRVKSEYVVMETDERYLGFIRKQLPAKYLCITNIQRDQAQRNGELSFIRGKIADVIDESMVVFVNQNDPSSYCLKDKAGRAVSYGVAENSRSYDKDDDFFSVGMPCPKCHNPVRYSKYNIENVGPFVCPTCGFGAGNPDYMAEDIDFENKHFSVGGNEYHFANNTPYFLYCYTMAVAVATELGVPHDKIKAALDSFQENRGLLEERDVAGKQLHYIKMKQENSETLQSSVNQVAQDPRSKSLMLYHTEYIDLFPPFINTFYLFDCDFQPLRRTGIDRWICMSDTQSKSIATRLRYDGYDDAGMVLLRDSREETTWNALKDQGSDDAYLIAELTYWKTWGGGEL